MMLASECRDLCHGNSKFDYLAHILKGVGIGIGITTALG